MRRWEDTVGAGVYLLGAAGSIYAACAWRAPLFILQAAALSACAGLRIARAVR